MWQQLNKLIIFNTKLVSEEYDSENSIFPLSQILLNSWNFKLDNKIDSQNFRQAQLNYLLTELRENEIVEKIRKRTKTEWTVLYLKRAVLMFINISIIAGAAVLIVYTN
jgi:hypothetical protein